MFCYVRHKTAPRTEVKGKCMILNCNILKTKNVESLIFVKMLYMHVFPSAWVSSEKLHLNAVFLRNQK